jgi:mono/diheme cytochrome c family protein
VSTLAYYPRRMRAGAPAALLVVIAALALGACGSDQTSVAGKPGVTASVAHGGQLFAQRCAGCHQLDVVGAEGGALKVKDREKVDGPNFNVRKEKEEQVLFAIRNGGFSGAIMPENIVVGKDAQDVATFLAKYAGHGKGN